MWIRAKVLDGDGGERVFNLDKALSWRGFGDQVELDMGCRTYRLEISDKRMEILTGPSGHYASDH